MPRTSRRDRALARVAERLRAPGPVGRRVAAVVLGWLVLMTVWGFGRAWHGDLAPVEGTIGLVLGLVVAAVAWRRGG